MADETKTRRLLEKAAEKKLNASLAGDYNEAKRWAAVQTHLAEELGDGPIVGTGGGPGTHLEYE